MKQELTVILSHLIELYGETLGLDVFQRLSEMMNAYRDRIAPPSQSSRLSERDAILITYGDQLCEDGIPPLQTLNQFCKKHLTGLVSGLHLLPFFPYSSDDGFSVIDYRAVNPDLGAWSDIREIGARFRLMFDAVINHVSVRSEWFQGFLRDDPKYRDYFIVVEGEPDLTKVVRPRALPLLTSFETPRETKRVWTTFSADQVDLNYTNPAVLLEVIDIILFYVVQGATFLRLDAIAYLWKEIGTTCIHLPQTHRIIQLLRAVLDVIAPHVMLITETNVPHAENISYFGDGHNEAQLVYNFALPPLVLHTLQTGDATALSDWAASLNLPSNATTFFNFLASHDGIGINPVRGILTEAEIGQLVSCVIDFGGLISYKEIEGGGQIPYELNINYFDALSNHDAESIEVQINRFMASQAIMLALVGIPGIYFHSLFGSRGWPEGVWETNQKRAINRQKLTLSAIEAELISPDPRRRQIFRLYSHLLQARAACKAFHPHGMQSVLDFGPKVFALLRQHPTEDQCAFCLQNVSSQAQATKVDLEKVFGAAPRGGSVVDLITHQRFYIRKKSPLHLAPYRTLWLVPDQEIRKPVALDADNFTDEK